jgi:hypothetical protein
LQRELLLGNLHQLHEEPTTDQAEEESIKELEVIYAYRDAKARLAALREWIRDTIYEQQIDSIAYDAARKWSLPQRGALEWFAKEYIFNERLYLWDENAIAHERIHRYRLIFDLAHLSASSLNETSRTVLSAVRNLGLEGQQSDDTIHIYCELRTSLSILDTNTS